MKNKKNRRSKNSLANWIFNQLLKIIRAAKRKKRLVGNLVKIYKVCDLRNSEDQEKKKLSGLIITREKSTYCIYINSEESPSEQIKTLIHEIGHFLFWWEYEPPIIKLENLIWNALSQEQKEILFEFIRKLKNTRQPK